MVWPCKKKDHLGLQDLLGLFPPWVSPVRAFNKDLLAIKSLENILMQTSNRNQVRDSGHSTISWVSGFLRWPFCFSAPRVQYGQDMDTKRPSEPPNALKLPKQARDKRHKYPRFFFLFFTVWKWANSLMEIVGSHIKSCTTVNSWGLSLKITGAFDSV